MHLTLHFPLAFPPLPSSMLVTQKESDSAQIVNNFLLTNPVWQPDLPEKKQIPSSKKLGNGKFNNKRKLQILCKQATIHIYLFQLKQSNLSLYSRAALKAGIRNPEFGNQKPQFARTTTTYPLLVQYIPN